MQLCNNKELINKCFNLIAQNAKHFPKITEDIFLTVTIKKTKRSKTPTRVFVDGNVDTLVSRELFEQMNVIYSNKSTQYTLVLKNQPDHILRQIILQLT